MPKPDIDEENIIFGLGEESSVWSKKGKKKHFKIVV